MTGEDAPASSRQSVQRFGRARRVRSFEDVVEQVRAAIASGSIGAGERLPSERELAEQFGVSRASLREALRALEALGLLEIRLGVRGGAFASFPDNERFASALSGLFSSQAGARAREFQFLRATFHADNAYWTGCLGSTLQAVSDSAEHGERVFLVALAQATGNPFRAALADAIEQTLTYPQGRKGIDNLSLRSIVELLRQRESAAARDVLYRLLSEDNSEPSPEL